PWYMRHLRFDRAPFPRARARAPRARRRAGALPLHAAALPPRAAALRPRAAALRPRAAALRRRALAASATARRTRPAIAATASVRLRRALRECPTEGRALCNRGRRYPAERWARTRACPDRAEIPRIREKWDRRESTPASARASNRCASSRP